MYTTLSPCFGCLKEAVQAGVSRIVYAAVYPTQYGPALVALYKSLAMHLAGNVATNFEPLGGDPAELTEVTQPDPYSDDSVSTAPIGEIQQFLKSVRSKS